MKNIDQLDRLHIASPCPVAWEQMAGDERVRFCDLCSFNVYNISEMTRKEVASLIESTEGRMCTRIYRRADGTVITKDCPVGLRAIRRRVAKTAGAVFATVVSLCAVVMGQKPAAKDQSSCPSQVTISRKVTDSPTASGVIAGTIHSSYQTVVPGTKVTMTNVKTGKVSETESNAEGRFEIAGLESGTYQVSFNSTSFYPLEVKEVQVQEREIVSFDEVLLSPYMLSGITSIAIELPSLLNKTPYDKAIFTGDQIRRY
jgi:hypothetical protein